MRSADDISGYIIWSSHRNNIAVSNLKLQKILYFVQAEFLVSIGSPCFHENIEAWDFGPVVPEIYRKYRVYGGCNIPAFFVDDNTNLEDYEREIVDAVIMSCADYTASDLVEITHNQSPWEDNYISGRCNLIPLYEIRDYFAEDLEKQHR